MGEVTIWRLHRFWPRDEIAEETFHRTRDRAAKLAAHCRDWWGEEGIEGTPPDDDAAAIGIYMEHRMDEDWVIEEISVG